MRALASVLNMKDSPVKTIEELKDTKNVAMVMVHAEIPKHGAKRGERLNCYVTSIFGAKSLRGGRLLICPLENGAVDNSTLTGTASGPISIENDVETTGIVRNGVVMQQDIRSYFVDKKRGHIVTLLVHASHANFLAAFEVASAINDEMTRELSQAEQDQGKLLAKAVSPNEIEVQIPPQYHDSPVRFIAMLLEIGIETDTALAKVVVNARTNVVIVTGDAEISPVVVRSKSTTVQVGGRGQSQFVSVADPDQERKPQKLKSLVAALNQLRVPPEEVIHIIQELHHSGSLHAIYEER